MKMLFAISSAVAALATVAFAANPTEQRAWMDTIATYDFKHPMEVKCSDFVTAEPAVQEHVVAYLEGRSHGMEDVAVVDDYTPVSIVEIKEECNQQPDTNVWDLVKSKTAKVN